MKYLYIPLCVAAVILAAFFVGQSISRERCRYAAARATINAHQQNIKKIGEINAETYHRDTADIRRWLFEKYTVAK